MDSNVIQFPPLTAENYYDDKFYLSTSGVKSFMVCEAAALAEYKDEFQRPSTQALTISSYLDAAVDGSDALDKFRLDHPEIFKRDGTLKAEYMSAEETLTAIRNDDLFSRMLGGQHQMILTGEIGGVPYKGKPDIVLSAAECDAIAKDYPNTRTVLSDVPSAIIDLKYMKDVADIYDPERGEKIRFWEAYGYHMQGGAYQELYYQRYGIRLPFILAVATKESPSGLHLYHINDGWLADGLAQVAAVIPRIVALRNGEEPPTRCEHCAYCRKTKRLDAILPAEYAGI